MVLVVLVVVVVLVVDCRQQRVPDSMADCGEHCWRRLSRSQ